MKIRVIVKNEGEVPGKEVVQVYVNPPQGVLGKPSRSLAAFLKTKELQPGEEQAIACSIDTGTIASYDDGGLTGNRSCYVLEKGSYAFYVGSDVRGADMREPLSWKRMR